LPGDGEGFLLLWLIGDKSRPHGRAIWARFSVSA
jgi:hypothetical protein